MPITSGHWIQSPHDRSTVIAAPTATRPYSVIVCECPGYAPDRDDNARAIQAVPRMIQMLERLVRTQGALRIHRGMATFPDGSTVDLNALLVDITGRPTVAPSIP